MEVDGAPATAQEAQARQVPATVSAETSTGSGGQASSASQREMESREHGDMSPFVDMDVEGDTSEPAEELQGSVTHQRWQMCDHADENSNDCNAGDCDGYQWRYLQTSQRRGAGSAACARSSRERENLGQFGVYERVPRHRAVGKTVRVQ